MLFRLFREEKSKATKSEVEKMKAYYHESVEDICTHLPKIMQDWIDSKSIALKMDYMLDKERKKEQQVLVVTIENRKE